MILASHGIIGSSISQFTSGLLDTYTGAAAAYSLRRLSIAYTGSAIRVRRASDNTEQDIGFVGEDLDTSALTTFCSGTNGFVKTWYDQSGNGRDASQTTASNQPQIVSSGSVILENGKPTLEFDGTNDFFTFSNILTNTDFSGFQVVKRNSTTTISVTMAGSASLDSYLLWNFSDNTAYFRSSQGYIQQALDIITQQLFTSININGGNMYMYNNGSLLKSDTPTGSGNNVMNTIGKRYTNYGEGNTQEIVVWSSDQSSNRTGIETNINDFYSIY